MNPTNLAIAAVVTEMIVNWIKVIAANGGGKVSPDAARLSAIGIGVLVYVSLFLFGGGDLSAIDLEFLIAGLGAGAAAEPVHITRDVVISTATYVKAVTARRS